MSKKIMLGLLLISTALKAVDSENALYHEFLEGRITETDLAKGILVDSKLQYFNIFELVYKYYQLPLIIKTVLNRWSFFIKTDLRAQQLLLLMFLDAVRFKGFNTIVPLDSLKILLDVVTCDSVFTKEISFSYNYGSFYKEQSSTLSILDYIKYLNFNNLKEVFEAIQSRRNTLSAQKAESTK